MHPCVGFILSDVARANPVLPWSSHRRRSMNRAEKEMTTALDDLEALASDFQYIDTENGRIVLTVGREHSS